MIEGLFLGVFPVLMLGFYAAIAVLMFRAKNRLIDRHPEIFLKAERKAWFPGMGLYRVLFGRFSFGSKYAELGDDELNRIVRNLKFALLGFPVIIIAVVGITLASQTN